MFKIIRLLVLLLALTLLGTFGFYFLEGWSLLDSLYMAVITLTTVGFQEVHPLSQHGKIFVILYLMISLGMFLYILSEVGRLLLESQLRDWFKERKMAKELQNLDDHYIICGFGGMGKNVSQLLDSRGSEFVVIDRSPDAIKECNDRQWPWILGDATDDAVLRAAGIDRSRGLAAVLPSDSDNVYVVLSARILSPDIQIIAKASSESVISKLEKAGANRVVSLYATGANRISQLLTNPEIADFLETFSSTGTEIDMAELEVTASSPFINQTLVEARFNERGIIIVGIRHPSGEFKLPPPPREPISEGDLLIVAGRSEAVQGLLNLN